MNSQSIKNLWAYIFKDGIFIPCAGCHHVSFSWIASNHRIQFEPLEINYPYGSCIVCMFNHSCSCKHNLVVRSRNIVTNSIAIMESHHFSSHLSVYPHSSELYYLPFLAHKNSSLLGTTQSYVYMKFYVFVS